MNNASNHDINQMLQRQASASISSQLQGFNMLTKEQLRLEALRLAVSLDPTGFTNGAESIVETAEAFADFLMGTTDRAALAKEAKGAIDKLAR